ncbi:hypothetical protein MFFC18_21400 [Mariniblastus fucicola]|uniref:Uncharacterized protein n=1 Tax=Mariniblastus fucicola TaxID=980251 RepID=A0A5B9P7F6_9BACT|nr:hypothetical protein MFFC18_21400 [Mariniblastus fucicola]
MPFGNPWGDVVRLSISHITAQINQLMYTLGIHQAACNLFPIQEWWRNGMSIMHGILLNVGNGEDTGGACTTMDLCFPFRTNAGSLDNKALNRSRVFRCANIVPRMIG